jgi:hypothetical protein
MLRIFQEKGYPFSRFLEKNICSFDYHRQARISLPELGDCQNQITTESFESHIISVRSVFVCSQTRQRYVLIAREADSGETDLEFE